MYLTYSIMPDGFAIYAWHERVLGLVCKMVDAEGIALTFIHRLESGDLSAAIQCARWLLANKADKCNVETFSLGPCFDFRARKVYDHKTGSLLAWLCPNCDGGGATTGGGMFHDNDALMASCPACAGKGWVKAKEWGF